MNDSKTRFGVAAVAAAVVLSGAVAFGLPSTENDWRMWGGSPDRNMVSSMTGLPSEWDVASGANIRWVAPLGSQTYGNPVVANGKVFVGTNNEALHDPAKTGDAGVLVAFSEETGEFLWQHFSDKLASGRVNDWPYQGVCSSPAMTIVPVP